MKIGVNTFGIAGPPVLPLRVSTWPTPWYQKEYLDRDRVIKKGIFDALKAYICHVHLKDVRYTTKKCPDVCRDGSYIECCPWGEGIVPVRDVVKRLIADGYSGSCAVEYAAPKREGLFPNMDRLEKFICYLNDERQTEMEEK